MLQFVGMTILVFFGISMESKSTLLVTSFFIRVRIASLLFGVRMSSHIYSVVVFLSLIFYAGRVEPLCNGILLCARFAYEDSYLSATICMHHIVCFGYLGVWRKLVEFLK